jgi:molybdate transport system substrate-binding protein
MTRLMKIAKVVATTVAISVAGAFGAAAMASGAEAAEITVIGSKVGAPADLIVTTPESIDDLIKAGKVVAGSRVDFIRSSAGVAVRAGAPKPDIGTPEAFKNVLLAGKSVGISKGPSGFHMLSLLERLGIADAAKAKAAFTEPGQRVGLAIADGKAEIGVQQITELLAMPGIDSVGPLPPALQTTIIYATARSTSAKETTAANEFVEFLSSKSVVPSARRMGLDPLLRRV